ncbi:TPA: cell division protein FtsK [Enterococcus faecium]|nr:cell division protein FtsK [Enterococcus faecium]
MAMKLLEKVKKRAEKAESILLDKEPNIKLNGKFSVNMLNTKAKDPTDAIFGIKPDGTIAHFCISEMPHMLVAGTTGSGKSVLLNEILVTAMCHSTPDELKIGIVDPKRVEFGRYKKLPFMLADPITDMDEAYDFFEYLVILMHERYKLMGKAGLQNITLYNEYAEKNGLDRFPYVILLVDEYSQLVGTHKEVEGLIVQLGQMARAAGIHVILATQSPRSTVVTGIIKANFPSRVCLMVASDLESRIVLDEGGGESLSPKGDMIIKLVNGSMVRAQGAYISNKEIETIFNHLRNTMPEPEYVDYRAIVAESRGEGGEDEDFGGIGKAPVRKSAKRNLNTPLANSSSKEPSIEKKSTFALKLEKNKEEKEKQGAKTLEKLQAEKLEKVLKALDKADSEPQTSNNTNNEQPISSKTKPKTTDPKVSVNVTITTDKSEKKQVNGTTSPIMQKMLKAKKQVHK